MATITTVVDQNPHFTLREISEVVGVSYITVGWHLHAEEYINQVDVWVPHDLSERKLTQRILVWDELTKRNRTEPFLKNMIAGDEKWIMYNNIVHHRHNQRQASILGK